MTAWRAVALQFGTVVKSRVLESKSINTHHHKKPNQMTTDSFKCPLTGYIVVNGKLSTSGLPLQAFTSSDQSSAGDEKLELAAMIERAKNGNAEAMYVIGNWYNSGIKGLARSSSDAHWWWERACEHQPKHNAESNEEINVQWISILEFSTG